MCLKNHFGNCDKTTINNEYCLFHKPNKNEFDSYIFYYKILVSTENYKRINRISNKPLNRLIFDYRIDF